MDIEANIEFCVCRCQSLNQEYACVKFYGDCQPKPFLGLHAIEVSQAWAAVYPTMRGWDFHM